VETVVDISEEKSALPRRVLNEVFDPESELSSVREIQNRTEREFALSAYEKKLAYQIQGRARLLVELLGTLKNESEAKEVADSLIREYAVAYGMPPKQEEAFKEVLTLCLDTQARIKEIKASSAEKPEEAYKALFPGKDPEGRIEVIWSPLAIGLNVYDIHDYAWGYFPSLENPADITEKHLYDANATGGFKGSRTDFKAVIVTNCSTPTPRNQVEYKPRKYVKEAKKSSEPLGPEQVFRHEEQHVLQEFIFPAIVGAYGEELYGNADNVFSNFNKNTKGIEPNSQEAERELRNALVLVRNNLERRLGNEVLAFLLTPRDLDVVEDWLTRPHDSEGVYDWRHSESAYHRNQFTTGRLGERFGQVADKVADQVFEAEEYKVRVQRIVHYGIEGIKALRRAGYSDEMINAMFLQIPIKNWYTMSQRLVREKLP